MSSALPSHEPIVLFDPDAAILFKIVFLVSLVRVAQAAACCHMNVVVESQMEATGAIRSRNSPKYLAK